MYETGSGLASTPCRVVSSVTQADQLRHTQRAPAFQLVPLELLPSWQARMIVHVSYHKSLHHSELASLPVGSYATVRPASNSQAGSLSNRVEDHSTSGALPSALLQ